MAVGGGAADGGEEGGAPADNERQLLEAELAEVECTLVGEVQQIERLAQENNRKVMPDEMRCNFFYYDQACARCRVAPILYGRLLLLAINRWC